MNWKNESIDKLRNYSARCNAIATIPEELEELDARMTSIRSARLDGDPVRGGGNGYEDRILNLITRKDALAENLFIATRQCERVTRGLETLTPEERRILEVFYIRRPYNHVDLLCEELHVEQSQVYYRKDAALRKFTLAMYGVVEF